MPVFHDSGIGNTFRRKQNKLDAFFKMMCYSVQTASFLCSFILIVGSLYLFNGQRITV